MKERFGAKLANSQKLRFHTQTAGSTLTAKQPENNVVRVTLQALAAVLGGTQSLHTNSMDEALWLPTEKSVQVALRTQQIIGYESGVADVIDPLAGSYMVEYLTDEIEKKALEYLQKIDEMGGALKAIENGYIQGEIQNAAFAAQRRLENREDIVVGVNKFTVDEKIELESLKIDPKIESEQRERLAALRADRDQVLVDALLERLENAAQGDENMMPIIIECVENKLTLGEICGRLRKVWGEYRAPTFI